jgi:hypothetical protein
MDKIYICRKRNQYNNKYLQRNKSPHSLSHSKNNTKQLAPQKIIIDKYNSSGVYKLTCPDCKKAYVGQTGQNFHTRYKEHKRAFNYNTSQSKFAQHIITQGHTFDTFQNTMEILHIHEKGTYLNTLERYHTHMEAKNNNHLNEDLSETSNPIFDTIIQILN